jgi:hypothetical protein
MRFGIALTLTATLALAGAANANAATAAGGSMLRYATSEQSPSGNTAETGTLQIVTTRAGAITLTIQPDGGKPPETTALVVGAGGSFALDPTVKAPSGQAAINRAIQFMTEIVTANYIGTGASSSQSASSFTIPPVTVLPAGSGSAVQTQITLGRNGFQYTGSVQLNTTTVLPSTGTKPVPDSISLVVGVNTTNNQLGAIEGLQTDRATLGKSVRTVVSRWTFSAAN